MPVNKEKYHEIIAELSRANAVLVAVSKLQAVEDIKAMYDLGQRDFGENYVQELLHKQSVLPSDIRWHFIGHLQRNKVKYIAPFVHLVHGVDSLQLLKEVNKQGKKLNRLIPCLLQVHIAREETKFGMNGQEAEESLNAVMQAPQEFQHVAIQGLMSMASFSSNMQQVRSEMKELKKLFEKMNAKCPQDVAHKMKNEESFRLTTQYSQLPAANSTLQTLSMGMSGDYKIAVEEGSTMVRIGSLLFGERKAGNQEIKK